MVFGFLKVHEFYYFANYGQTKIRSAMENQLVETRMMRPLEVIKIELVSRGPLGLQLLFKMDIDSIVEVKRVEPIINQVNPPRPGDSIGAFFEIRAIKNGNVKITFYETQPWNKDFKDIIQKEINVEVVE